MGFTIRQSCTIILWRYLGTHAMENSQVRHKIVIGNKLQDVHDGKDVYLTAEEVEKDRQAWLKTQTPSEKLQEQLEPIIDEDKDEDEVGEEPDTEEEQA